MAATPKAKPPSARAPERKSERKSERASDRTSSIVTGTLIFLTVLGVITVFWEPLTALAIGAPASDSMGEARAPSADGGLGPASAPSVSGAAGPTGGPMDGSSSS